MTPAAETTPTTIPMMRKRVEFGLLPLAADGGLRLGDGKGSLVTWISAYCEQRLTKDTLMEVWSEIEMCLVMRTR